MDAAGQAAWVQAFGTILAILGAAFTAIWQTSRQHKSALQLQEAQQRRAQVELAKALSVLANNCSAAMRYLTLQIKDRESIYQVAERLKPFDIGELGRQDAALAAVPLLNLPSTLIMPVMLLSATVRQFREKVEMGIRLHLSMDSSQFDDFFLVLEEMNRSISETCKDIAKIVDRMETRQGGL